MHNRQARWLSYAKEQLDTGKAQEDPVISERSLGEVLKKLSNWKASGPDGVQEFWIKNLSALHRKLEAYLEQYFNTGYTPLRMTTGQKVLIQKDVSKGTASGNYRPIICLPIAWKLLTSIHVLADEIYWFLEDDQLLGEEQNAVVNDTEEQKITCC